MLMLSSGRKEKKEGFWVKDIRTRGKREAVGQKKLKYLLLGAAPTAAQKSEGKFKNASVQPCQQG